MKKQLTVSELVKLLKKQDKSLLVWCEGCDCQNEAIGIKAYRKHLLIKIN